MKNKYKHLYILILFFSVSCSNSALEDIINKNLIARGGADKWSSLRNAAYGYKFQIQGIEMPIYIAKKGFDKINMQMGMGSMGLTTIINGEIGWNNVMNKVETLKDQALNQSKFQLITQYLLVEPILLNWKEKGYSLSNEGIEKVGKEEWQKIKVTDKNDKKFTVFVEKSSWLEKRVDTEVEVNKKSKILSLLLDEYKIYEGMQLPTSLIIKMDTVETGRINLADVKFNTEMNESLFMQPVVDTATVNKHKSMHGMIK